MPPTNLLAADSVCASLIARVREAPGTRVEEGRTRGLLPLWDSQADERPRTIMKPTELQRALARVGLHAGPSETVKLFGALQDASSAAVANADVRGCLKRALEKPASSGRTLHESTEPLDQQGQARHGEYSASGFAFDPAAAARNKAAAANAAPLDQQGAWRMLDEQPFAMAEPSTKARPPIPTDNSWRHGDFAPLSLAMEGNAAARDSGGTPRKPRSPKPPPPPTPPSFHHGLGFKKPWAPPEQFRTYTQEHWLETSLWWTTDPLARTAGDARRSTHSGSRTARGEPPPSAAGSGISGGGNGGGGGGGGGSARGGWQLQPRRMPDVRRQLEAQRHSPEFALEMAAMRSRLERAQGASRRHREAAARGGGNLLVPSPLPIHPQPDFKTPSMLTWGLPVNGESFTYTLPLTGQSMDGTGNRKTQPLRPSPLN